MSAEFVACMEDVLDLYEEPHNPSRPRVCFNEKSVQLIEAARDPLPAEPGKATREIKAIEEERNKACDH